ncbi:MAG TPA: hypothetical protein VGO34_00745 [Alphaproteobacteria bacterium]|jgi:hypothetical protein
MKRLAFLAAVLLLAGGAADLQKTAPIFPTVDYATTPLAADEAYVVIGYAFRGVERSRFNVEYPVHLGWMPVDGKTGARIGKAMVTATERCAQRRSAACDQIQYRVYRIPAGDYALAWIFRGDFYGIANFEGGEVTFNSGTQEIVRTDLPENATAKVGTPGFTVHAGEVVYVGNLAVTFNGNKPGRMIWAWTRDDAIAVAELMKSTPYVEQMKIRQGITVGRTPR